MQKAVSVELVFCYQNCFDLLLGKKKAEGREFAKLLRSLEQLIQTVKGRNNFWRQNAFLTCSWRFLRSQKIEQIKKNIGILKSEGKVRKK